jgi:hypothetical protein
MHPNMQWGRSLSQKDEAGTLHLCAFFPHKFILVEQNYEIYDKEMLVIVEALETWRHYLEDSGNKATVYSDHKNLLWFTETKLYNCRQARWAEKLSRFDFCHHISTRKRPRQARCAIQKTGLLASKRGGRENKSNEFLFLKPHQVDLSHLENAEQSVSAHLVALKANAIDSVPTDDKLAKAIETALLNDLAIAQHLESLHNRELPRQEDPKALLEPFTIDDGLVLRNRLVYVHDENFIKLRILKSCHDSPSTSHLGEAKTLELVTCDYYWPRIRRYVEDYVKSCDACARNKTL